MKCGLPGHERCGGLSIIQECSSCMCVVVKETVLMEWEDSKV